MRPYVLLVSVAVQHALENRWELVKLITPGRVPGVLPMVHVNNMEGKFPLLCDEEKWSFLCFHQQRCFKSMTRRQEGCRISTPSFLLHAARSLWLQVVQRWGGGYLTEALTKNLSYRLL